MGYAKGLDWPEEGMGYIYSLNDPLTGESRYVGKTEKSIKIRLCHHINSVKVKGSASSKTPVGIWMLGLLEDGLKPNIKEVAYVPIVDLDNAEISHIAIARIGGKLLNIEAGGKTGRVAGFKMSKEFCDRQKISKAGFNSANYYDRVGERHKQLTVISFDGFRDGTSWWVCKCDCGNNKTISVKKLLRLKSCGCAKKTRWTEEEKEKLRAYNKIHKIYINGKFAKNLG